MDAEKEMQPSMNPGKEPKSDQKEVTTAKDRWHDLAKLIVGFVLTGVVGTWLTHVYKERETRTELQRKEIEASGALFYELVESFSKRHFYALRADIAAERWNDKADSSWRYEEGRKRMEDAYRLYQESLTEWNLRRFRMEAILQTHFAQDYRRQLDEIIIPILNKTEDDLEDLHEFAVYKDYYAQYLHDRILERIEGEEEKSIQTFFDGLSSYLRQDTNPPNGILERIAQELGWAGVNDHPPSKNH